MRILYGIQATGNGHISRSKEIIRILKLIGHDIQVIFSGRNQNLLRETDIFEPFVVYRGLTFITSQGRIKFLKTASQLNFIQFYRDILSFDLSDYNLVITDFEPVSAYIAKRNNIPSIGIGHQYAFYYNIPFINTNSLSYFILRYFAPVDYSIGLHWHHFGQPILPPIIPDSLTSREVKKDKILVYLPFEDKDGVSLVLQNITTHHFYIYNNFEKIKDVNNLHYRSYTRSGFLSDLSDCHGVICNAGFELPSEALHLGKKILVKPLLGQIEQESNALSLSQLKLGIAINKLKIETIQNWLNSPSNKPMKYPNVAEHIAKWIDSGCWDDITNLAQSLWVNK